MNEISDVLFEMSTNNNKKRVTIGTQQQGRVLASRVIQSVGLSIRDVGLIVIQVFFTLIYYQSVTFMDCAVEVDGSDVKLSMSSSVRELVSAWRPR